MHVSQQRQPTTDQKPAGSCQPPAFSAPDGPTERTILVAVTILGRSKGNKLMSEDKRPVRILTADDLSRFIDDHRNQLRAWVERNLGPALRTRVEPDDILQETALTAVSSLEQFLVPGRDPFRLLCQMIEQRIIDAHRYHVAAQKRSAAKEVPMGGRGDSDDGPGFMDLLVASMTSPSAAFSRNQKELRLQLALQELTEEQRLTIRLRFVEGLPTKDIAEQIGKSDGAVRVLLSRTIAQLQERLAETPADASPAGHSPKSGPGQTPDPG